MPSPTLPQEDRQLEQSLVEAKGGLTPTMTAAVRHAEAHGGLVRQPGGSWVAPQDADDWSWGRIRFGASTVNGLVKRGLLTFTEHKDGRNGRFPIRATATGSAA